MPVSRNHRTDKTFFQLESFFKLASVFVLLLWLTGCAQTKLGEVDSVESILPVADSHNLPDVIKTLIKQSDEQYLNLNLPGSLATLERAVRINPRHAEVWSRMAQVYLKQGNLEQAKQLAKRSNSVLKNNAQLKAFNDRIIATTSAEQIH